MTEDMTLCDHCKNTSSNVDPCDWTSFMKDGWAIKLKICNYCLEGPLNGMAGKEYPFKIS